MPNAFISGTGFYMPPRVVTNHDLIARYGLDTTHEWIVERTGIEARRFADEGVGTSDLALEAAKQAISNAGLTIADIDLILFATLSPDHAFPGSGVYLQAKLGFGELDPPKLVPAMDIRNQCSGFMYGLSTANSFVRAGTARHVLVVGAETHSAALDLTSRGRTIASLFGDGAGAVVVSATDEDRGIRGCWLGSDGRFANALAQRVWDIKRRPFMPQDAEGRGIVAPEDMFAQMNGKQVMRHAVEKMTIALMQACWDQGINANDIDLFAFHQANLRVNQYVANQLGIPAEKMLQNIERFGNTTAATIPSLLAEAEQTGRLKRGMKVACVAFGSGFTWGSSIIDW